MDRVCVVGAGSSGIAACQVLHARGIPFDCFEAGSEVGGNWRYLNDNEMSSAYRSLHINTSRDVMEYASYPMPKTLPNYPNHFQIAAYFDAYVDHFGLRDKITFRAEVVRVRPAGSGWQVTTRRRDAGEETTAASLDAGGISGGSISSVARATFTRASCSAEGAGVPNSTNRSNCRSVTAKDR